MRRRPGPTHHRTVSHGRSLETLNYYEHHLGDYLKDTLGLSMLQEGAYRRLLDAYYSREQGIPKDQAYLVARASSKAEKSAVDFVLKSFFKLSGGIWRKDRCDQEIARYLDKREKARLAGIASGNARRTDVERTLERNGERNGNPPDSSLHSPNNKNPEAKNGLPPNPEGLAKLHAVVAPLVESKRVPR